MSCNGLVDVTDYGAVGDGVNDDTAAILAARAAAKASGKTLYFPAPPPPTIARPNPSFTTAVEIALDWPTARVIGVSSNRLSPTVRATAPMRSVFMVRTSNGSPVPEDQALNRGYFAHMTIDANFQAEHAIISLGAEMSSFEDLRALNALRCGIYVAVQVNPMTIGPVSAHVPGGSPAGVTIAQPVAEYVKLSGSNNSLTMRVAVATPGALGTATYKVSFDGGVSYQSAPQTIASAVNIPITSNDAVIELTGLVASFQAGPYCVGDYWDVPLTYNLGDYNGGPGVGTAQGAIVYRDITYGQCGSVYQTQGKQGSYGGFNTSIITGLLTITNGSPYLKGNGSTWMGLIGASSSRVMVQVDNDPNALYLGYILDNDTIAVDPGVVPTMNASGLQYTINVYGGFYEDFAATAHHENGQCGNCSNGLMFARGAGGPIVNGFTSSSTAGAGMALLCGQSEISNVFWASTSFYAAWFGVSSGGCMRNPSQAAQFYGCGVGWSTENNGQYSGLSTNSTLTSSASSWLPNAALLLSPSTQAITSASDQFTIPQPSFRAPGGTSYLRFTASADFIMTAQPTIPQGQLGSILVLHNSLTSVWCVTLQDDQDAFTGLILEARYITLSPQELAMFICIDGGKWKQLSPVLSSYATSNKSGNTGHGKRREVTVASTIPTELYRIEPVATGFSPGACMKFDIMAQSQGGQNWACWRDNFYGTDIHGNSVFEPGPARGSGAGNIPPLGWAISVDPTGTTPIVKFYGAGDGSSNPVTWVFVPAHRDPGQ